MTTEWTSRTARRHDDTTTRPSDIPTFRHPDIPTRTSRRAKKATHSRPRRGHLNIRPPMGPIRERHVDPIKRDDELLCPPQVLERRDDARLASRAPDPGFVPCGILVVQPALVRDGEFVFATEVGSARVQVRYRDQEDRGGGGNGKREWEGKGKRAQMKDSAVVLGGYVRQW